MEGSPSDRHSAAAFGGEEGGPQDSDLSQDSAQGIVTPEGEKDDDVAPLRFHGSRMSEGNVSPLSESVLAAEIRANSSQHLEEFRAAAAKSIGRSMTIGLAEGLVQRKGSSMMKPFAPQVTMDGTKLIIKLGRNDKFQYDSPCRVLLCTPRIKMEHCNVWTTQATCQDNENTIVLDSGGIGQRFLPIPLSHYGTLYSKEGTAHVVVGGEVRRSKVHSRHLPYKTCNKFQAQFVEDSEDEQLLLSRERSRQIGSLSPKKAMKMIQSLASDPHGGVVYLRSDESLIRYKLKHDERVEIQSGHIVAWTLGVRFEYRSICCFRFVSAVLGDGTVWICNPRRGGK